jgi:hypothetical protein
MASIVCIEGVNFIDSVLCIVGVSIKYLKEALDCLIVLKKTYSLVVESCTIIIITLEAKL